MAKRFFILTITDSDGDEHYYYFTSSNPWIVTNFVIMTMFIDKDFYGHTPDMTQDIEVAEQVGPDKTMTEIELL